MFSYVTFSLETVTTNMTYTTLSLACSAGALVILASSWKSYYTFDTALPKYHFHMKNHVDLVVNVMFVVTVSRWNVT